MNRPADVIGPQTSLRHGMAALDSRGEAERNRLLRRVDWRFLTGNPLPEKSVCFARRDLAKGVHLISTRTADPADPEIGGCDLAVAVNPDRNTVRKAWDALAPGGAFYAEWYKPWAGGNLGAAQRLKAAGFEEISGYWPWPWPDQENPAFWLPLNSPHALQFFLKNRPPVKSTRQKIGRRILQRLWRFANWANLLAPVCTVAYKPRQPEQRNEDLSTRDTALSTPRPAGQLRLTNRWQSWGLSPMKNMAWLLLTGGQHSANKVIALVFGESEKSPHLVVKLPRSHHSTASLEREAAALQAVHGLRPGGIPGVPQVIFSDLTGDFPALGETYLSGSPLYTYMRQENLSELALMASLWLSDLVHPADPQPRQSWWNRLVGPVLSEFEQYFGAFGVQGLLQWAEVELEQLEHLPLAIEQRDFSPWNVFITHQNGIVVLDWEEAEPHGLPVSDLIYFLAYLTFFHDQAMQTGRFGESYRAMLNPQTEMGRIAEEALQAYLDSTGLSRSAVRPLRLLTWLRRACTEYRLIADSSGAEPEPEVLRRSLNLILLNEELSLAQS